MFVMSSSGLASSTMKSALLPASMRARVGQPQKLRGRLRGGDDDLRRRHAGGHHVGHLRVRCPRRVAVGAERDLHAGRVQLREVARLNVESRLDGRAVGCRRLKASAVHSSGTLPRSQLRSLATPRSGRFGTTTTFGFDVNSAMTSSSTSWSRMPCAKASMPARSRPFASSSVEDVRDDAQTALVRLVDDCAVEGGRQLRVRAVPVVHPDLDDVHLSCGELADGRARLEPPW